MHDANATSVPALPVPPEEILQKICSSW